MASPSVSGVPGRSIGDDYTEAMWDTYIADNGNALGSHRSVQAVATGPDTFGAGVTNPLTWDTTNFVDTTYYSIAGTAGTVLVDGVYIVNFTMRLPAHGENPTMYMGIRLDGADIYGGLFGPQPMISGALAAWQLALPVSIVSAPTVISCVGFNDSVSIGTVDQSVLFMQYLGTAI